MVYLTSGKNKIMGSSVSTDADVITVIDENSTDEQIPSAKAVYDKLSDLPTDSGSKCYTTLDELGLTADATVEDVVNALKNGESFLAPVNIFTNYETIFPNKVPNDQWNKIHIIKGVSLASSHIRCFSQSGMCEYLANVNNTNVVSWNDVSGTYIDISDSTIEKLGTEILKYPVGKYRINSTTTGNKFTDLPSNAETKCGLIEINGTTVGKSPYTDTWVYRMYKFECLTGTSSYIRRLNSGATVGQIEADTGWQKDGHEIYTSLSQLGLTAPVSVGEIFNAMPEKTMVVLSCEAKDDTEGTVNILGIPASFGVLTIKKNELGRFSIEYQNSLQGEPCNVKRWIGTLKGSDGTGLYWKLVSTQSTYNSVAELNKAKGTSITLVNGVDNTQKIVDALSVGEQFISFYHNNANQNRFGIDASYGSLINEIRITKCLDADLTSNYAIATAFMNTGIVMSRIYYKDYSTDWCIPTGGNSTNYSKSSLSINSWSGYSSGKIYYQSVNGICYITVSDLCILSGEKTNSTQLPAGLVPATDVAQNLIDNKGKIIGRITIAEGNRTLIVKHLSANTGDSASLTFSYPIKTS